MSSQAPHLPDEFSSSYRRTFFLLLIIVSVLAGVAGGVMAVRLIVPEVLQNVVQSLPLSSNVRRIDMNEGPTPFSEMISLAQTLTSADGTSIASGVTFTADGWVVTDAARVNRVTHVRVDNEIKRIDGTRTVIDEPSGVAFVKISHDTFSSPRLANDVRFDAGDVVYVVSDELGILEARVSVPYGRIAPRGGAYEAHEFHRVFVLDRRVPDVLSGAPVFDDRGSLVGIITFNAQYEHQALVIPIHHFSQTFKDVVKNGQPSYPYLGVRYQPARVSGVNLSLFSSGQLVEGSPAYGVSAVAFNSPAWQAGIREGDRILSIENQSIGIRDTLPEVLMRYEPGQIVTIRYERDGQETEVGVELGSVQ